MTPVFPGARVEHDDALVAVTVGNVELVRRFVDDGERRAAQIARAVAALGVARFADLLDEFAVAGEFQHLGVVVLVVAGEPDVIVGVDVNAVLAARPVETAAVTTPGLHQIAFRRRTP